MTDQSPEQVIALNLVVRARALGGLPFEETRAETVRREFFLEIADALETQIAVAQQQLATILELRERLGDFIRRYEKADHLKGIAVELGREARDERDAIIANLTAKVERLDADKRGLEAVKVAAQPLRDVWSKGPTTDAQISQLVRAFDQAIAALGAKLKEPTDD